MFKRTKSFTDVEFQAMHTLLPDDVVVFTPTEAFFEDMMSGEDMNLEAQHHINDIGWDNITFDQVKDIIDQLHDCFPQYTADTWAKFHLCQVSARLAQALPRHFKTGDITLCADDAADLGNKPDPWGYIGWVFYSFRNSCNTGIPTPMGSIVLPKEME